MGEWRRWAKYAALLIVWAALSVWMAYLAYQEAMRFTDSSLRDFEAWLMTHDRTIEMGTFAALSFFLAVWGAVKLISWWALRHQIDMTNVGRSLKWQKLAEVVMAAGMSTVYGLAFWASLLGYEFGVWQMLGLRSLALFGIIWASVWGVKFVLALLTERRTP